MLKRVPNHLNMVIKLNSARRKSEQLQQKPTNSHLLRSLATRDHTPPDFELWIDGVKPQKGSVIAPRPHISILLEDENGVDLDTIVIRRGDNGKPLEPISEYILRNPKDVNTVPIDYKPILFPGEYAYEIEARDFNGNAIGGKSFENTDPIPRDRNARYYATYY